MAPASYPPKVVTTCFNHSNPIPWERSKIYTILGFCMHPHWLTLSHMKTLLKVNLSQKNIFLNALQWGVAHPICISIMPHISYIFWYCFSYLYVYLPHQTLIILKEKTIVFVCILIVYGRVWKISCLKFCLNGKRKLKYIFAFSYIRETGNAYAYQYPFYFLLLVIKLIYNYLGSLD